MSRPAILFADPPTHLYAGDCDTCPKGGMPATHVFNNYYLCSACLIEKVDAGEIPFGSTIYRLPLAWGFAA